MKKVIAIMLGAITLFCFSACTDNSNDEDYVPEYNAILYDDASELIQEEFQANNSIKITGSIDDTDNSIPTERTFIITDNEYYNDVFVDSETIFEVDFNEEMLLVYTFGIEYVLPAKITNIVLSNKTLTINFKIQLIQDTTSACQPFQRWFVIKLDKLDITTAIITQDK